MNLRSKLPNVGTTIFTEMSALAAKHKAINLSQGFPGYVVDSQLIDLVTEAMFSEYNQYAPMSGHPLLKEAIAHKMNYFYGASCEAETEVTITSGATEALFCAIAALVSTGDEVIFFEPAYDSYVPVIELFGGIPVGIPLELPNFRLPLEELRNKISSKTKLIIINTPHNPTGMVWSEQEYTEFVSICQETKAFILSDEVYEHLVLAKDKKHQSLCMEPSLKERVVSVFSFGKSLHATGWKVGYCIAGEQLTSEIRKIHQYNTFSTSTPFQIAIAKFITDMTEFEEIPSFFEQKRDVFLNALEGSRFKTTLTEGTYFQLLDYSEFSQAHDLDFAKDLLIKGGVASIPLSPFYQNKQSIGKIRICFAKIESELIAAAKALKAYSLSQL